MNDLDDFRHCIAIPVGFGAPASHAAPAPPLDDLQNAFAALEQSTTHTEVLTNLTRGLQREFRRVVLVQCGLTLDGLDAVPADGLSLLSRAAHSRRIEVAGRAIAVPIVFRGSTTAVLYADDPNQELGANVPDARVKFADLLQRHALLVMLRISVHETGKPTAVQSMRR